MNLTRMVLRVAFNALRRGIISFNPTEHNKEVVEEISGVSPKAKSKFLELLKYNPQQLHFYIGSIYGNPKKSDFTAKEVENLRKTTISHGPELGISTIIPNMDIGNFEEKIHFLYEILRQYENKPPNMWDKVKDSLDQKWKPVIKKILPFVKLAADLDALQKEKEQAIRKHEEAEESLKEWSSRGRKKYLDEIKMQVNEMERYLGKCERGIDVTGNLKYHLEKIEKAFEDMKEERSKLEKAVEEAELDVDDIEMKMKHSKTAAFMEFSV